MTQNDQLTISSWNSGGLTALPFQIRLTNIILSHPNTIFLISETHLKSSSLTQKLKKFLIHLSPNTPNERWSGMALFSSYPYKHNISNTFSSNRVIHASINSGANQFNILF